MPSVGYLDAIDGAQADPQKPEGMVRLFDRGVRSPIEEVADGRTTTPPMHLMPY